MSSPKRAARRSLVRADTERARSNCTVGSARSVRANSRRPTFTFSLSITATATTRTTRPTVAIGKIFASIATKMSIAVVCLRSMSLRHGGARETG